jgi:hypothetical protein
MTRLAKPEKKAGKGNERRGMYANRRIKAIGRPAAAGRCRCLLQDPVHSGAGAMASP